MARLWHAKARQHFLFDADAGPPLSGGGAVAARRGGEGSAGGVDRIGPQRCRAAGPVAGQCSPDGAASLPPPPGGRCVLPACRPAARRAWWRHGARSARLGPAVGSAGAARTPLGGGAARGVAGVWREAHGDQQGAHGVSPVRRQRRLQPSSE